MDAVVRLTSPNVNRPLPLNQQTTFESTRAALREGRTTCEEVTRQYLAAIEKGKHLNAFLSVFQDRAMAHAREVDRKIAGGNAGRLAGMVIAIKDVICMKDERATCGSRILENFVSVYDATVIRQAP